MVTSTVRQQVKSRLMGSSFLQAVYLKARYLKRSLHNTALTAEEAPSLPCVSAQTLRSHATTLGTYARFHYTLALKYLFGEALNQHTPMPADAPSNLYRALACLRCAEALGFEAPERAVLYRALILAKWGQIEAARSLVQPLTPYEMTPEEQKWQQQILAGSIVPEPVAAPIETADWEAAIQDWKNLSEPQSVLLIGEAAALSARHRPDDRYFLAASEINGFSAADVARLPMTFTLGIASVREAHNAQQAGVQCDRWILLRP